jgi:amidase
MTDTLWMKSASELARLIADKEVSSREVVQSCLDRIDAVNGQVNAVTVVLADTALAAADQADSQPAAGPLHGVPFTIKENIDCVGSASTNGVPALADAMPTRDAPVVARMKSAGAIPLARTNLPELGLRISTANPLRGKTLNPWDATRTAGGSSGGEGSALATGMTPIGLGNDIGGSLRNPAYCCGITALKPSTGRIPSATTIPPVDRNLSWQLMCVEGPMARRVADLRLALSILAGSDPRDPVAVDVPLEGPSPARKRAALVTRVPGVELPAVLVDAVRRAGDGLAAAGWEIEEADPPELERITELWAHVLTADFESEIELFAAVMSERPLDILRNMIAVFPPASMTASLLHSERWRLSCAWTAFFEEFPLVVGPTWTKVPWHFDADLAEGNEALTVDTLRFITPGNLLGIPSVAVPTGVVDGLPTGVQVYADRWREDLCLLGAELVELAVGAITPIDPVG